MNKHNMQGVVMPLSKKRDRQRKQRQSNPARLENTVRSINSNPARLESKPIEIVQPKQERLAELRQLIQSKSSPVKEESNSRLPLYNPAIHGPGDRVRMRSPYNRKKFIETVIPELDAGGQPITDYS